MVKVCLPGESGEILDQLGLDLSAIDGVDDAMSQMKSFNVDELKTKIGEGLQTVEDEIKIKLYYSDYFDLSNQQAITYLSKMARPNIGFPTCTF